MHRARGAGTLARMEISPVQDVDEDALEQGAEPEQEGAPEAEERAEGAETPQDEELSDSLDEDEAQAPAEEPLF